ncbi:hypothetical protein [Actinomadura alba]|uniref:Uncharacterized protein n=1 Tax=Actinomadura alba TaxID=406431 RepID=A0ABR7M1R1_9ACTN|nr:hypothetical protein [Actinomadura alba]MBC6470838.1 hypothetical protein [Actinomadura alba]
MYPVFADVRPETAERQLTLGTDISAPGDFRPEPLPKAERTARIGDYTVKLTGDLVPGKSSRLTLSVSRAGRPAGDRPSALPGGLRAPGGPRDHDHG